jgi:hypothetical protein
MEAFMLTENRIKEQLSIAYIQAIASYAGFAVENTRIDMDSIDVTIKARGLLHQDSVFSSPKIELQLKATSGVKITDREFSFALPIKNYDDLKVEKPIVPRLLVVLCLPDDRTKWLEHSADMLIMRKCVYWANLKGMPECENETTKTIRILVDNLLSSEKLKDLMIKTSKEEDL